MVGTADHTLNSFEIYGDVLVAWDTYLHNNLECYGGDRPFDVFHSALEELSADYKDRFGRPPRIIELLNALETIINTSKECVWDLEEDEDLTLEYKVTSDTHNSSEPNTRPKKKIDFEAPYDFEGAYTDITDPGYYLVSRTSNLYRDAKEEDCFKIPTLEVSDNILICEYEILIDDFDDIDACKLIKKYLLHKFSGDFYKDQASIILFKNIITDTTTSVPMQQDYP